MPRQLVGQLEARMGQLRSRVQVARSKATSMLPSGIAERLRSQGLMQGQPLQNIMDRVKTKQLLKGGLKGLRGQGLGFGLLGDSVYRTFTGGGVPVKDGAPPGQTEKPASSYRPFS